ncbi:retrovirus-related pol polyprotein LINE-1 [Tanacetum coccineum]|uniref:Retrovirus-related pol polyprotein LINE-1 n=1 Tax=Tanacetum coccineum TaxID=301880 RepID=A0ABQ4XLD9_9ASTR
MNITQLGRPPPEQSRAATRSDDVRRPLCSWRHFSATSTRFGPPPLVSGVSFHLAEPDLRKRLELADALERHRVDIACFQETKWKGSSNIEGNGYKLWYSGSLTARNGVGVILKACLKDKVVHVIWCSDRIITLTLVIDGETVNVIRVYAPQVGLRGDLNGHIRVATEGYAGVHGGFGYGVRNEEGRAILDFAIVHDLVVVNSHFKKRDHHLVTFQSEGRCIQIDYLMVRKGDLKACKDYRVFPREACSSQQNLLALDILGDATEAFRSKVAEGVSTRVEALVACDADSMWNALASIIKDAAKDALGVSIGTSKTHTARRESWWLCEEEGHGEGVGPSRQPHPECYYSRISQAEVRTALRKIGRNKAVGPDQIPIEAWRSLGDEGIFWLTSIFNKIFTSVKIPEEWRLSEERVIERRLRRETSVSENQFGFMPGRSSVEVIHLIRSLIEKYMERQRDLHMAYLDLEKAYDSIPRELIWKTLVEKGSSRRYIKNLRKISYNEEVDVCIKDKILQPKESFRYLRSMLHKSGRIDEDLKGKFYRVIIRPAMLYELECWPITKALANRVEVAELRMLRWTCGKTLLDMIPNGVYRAQLKAETIINKMREGRLRWFRHVRRRPQSSSVRRVEALVVDGLRRRGRPKLRWEDRVKYKMKELLLFEDMTSDRKE